MRVLLARLIASVRYSCRADGSGYESVSPSIPLDRIVDLRSIPSSRPRPDRAADVATEARARCRSRVAYHDRSVGGFWVLPSRTIAGGVRPASARRSRAVHTAPTTALSAPSTWAASSRSGSGTLDILFEA